MTYAECIKNIQAKLPDGWRCKLDVETSIGKDVKAEWWAGLYGTDLNKDLGAFHPTLAAAYQSIMARLDDTPQCDLHEAAVEEVDNA